MGCELGYSVSVVNSITAVAPSEWSILPRLPSQSEIQLIRISEVRPFLEVPVLAFLGWHRVMDSRDTAWRFVANEARARNQHGPVYVEYGYYHYAIV